ELAAIRSGGMYNLRDRRPEVYGEVAEENRVTGSLRKEPAHA
ncbi:MAG: carbon-nitrogen hydrolase family protein, partial [Mycobacteriaceae bacterium]